MRNAKILVIGLKGVATETIKNIVLAGIGKLVVVDVEDVSERDLGAGFFFRDEDVGKKVRTSVFLGVGSRQPPSQRVHAAKARIQSLNPLVKIETIDRSDVMEKDGLWAIVQSVDLVCMTDWNRESLVSVSSPASEKYLLGCLLGVTAASE
jgi:ubiquitin-like 1-activating enzyme E1 A